MGRTERNLPTSPRRGDDSFPDRPRHADRPRTVPATDITPAGEPQHGVIKRLQKDKGFGFIRAASGQEYFFHRSEAMTFDTLFEGLTVSFTPQNSSKGPRAHQVKLLP